MRIIRVRHKGQTFYASLGDGMVISMGRESSADPIPLKDVTLMPLVVPSKIIGIGFNYREQAEAFGLDVPDRPVFFLRPGTSLLSNGRSLTLPRGARRVFAEAELALVIGQPCFQVGPELALKHVFGYACANDLTVGDYADDPFQTTGKSFNGTCPVGPWLETHPPGVSELMTRCLVNGEVRQEGSVRDMLFSPAEIISYLSGIMTLNPGDVILCGSPPAPPPVQAGDTVQVEIPGIGVLYNTLVREDEEVASPVQ